jgi:hypothetical protein
MKTILLICSIILLSGCASRYEYADSSAQLIGDKKPMLKYLEYKDIQKMAAVNTDINTDENKTDTFKWIPFESK